MASEHRHLSQGFHFFLIIFLLSSLGSLNGCEPLRKKFIRKKKEDRQRESKFIPVLEPIEYPDKKESVLERYTFHYSLWQIWYKDLLVALEERGSDKRQRYILGQLIKHLEEMSLRLKTPKQENLARYIQEVKRLQSELEKPAALRNYITFRNKINSISKQLHKQFTKDKIEDFLVESGD